MPCLGHYQMYESCTTNHLVNSVDFLQRKFIWYIAQLLNILILQFLSTQDYAKSNVSARETILTQPPGIYKDDRPLLIVSSTSWTPDEDFSLLLRALDIYETRGTRDIMLVITGRGALRAPFEILISKRKYAKIRASCVWLHIDDYPLLLGSADVGVCMHSSSSGVDLPMKIVDMFGAGCPVLARR